MGLVKQLLSHMNRMARTNEYAVTVGATNEARIMLQVELENKSKENHVSRQPEKLDPLRCLLSHQDVVDTKIKHASELEAAYLQDPHENDVRKV